jgi:uncharacterized repeat protein (TIGR01451 family)
MTFITKQAGLLRSARSWGVLGLVLALAITVGYGQGDKQSPQVTQSGLFAVESSAPAPMGAGSYSRHARNAALAQQPPPCVPPPPGLVAWWPLDGLNPNGEYDDLANFDNNGTPIGNPATIPGYVNNALQAGSGYVQVTPASNLNFSTGPFTIDAWVKPGQVPGPNQQIEPIVAKWDPQTKDGYFLFLQLGKLYFQSGSLVLAGPPVTPGQWNFVAVVVNPPNVILYVGTGNLSSVSYAATINATNTQPLNIGLSPFNPHPNNIIIDEVEIFNRALDQKKDLEPIFNAGSAGKCKIGTVVINKSAVGGDDTFNYTATGNSIPSGSSIPSSFSITTTSGSGSQTFSNLASGSYTVTEQGPPSPWVFTSLVCTDPDGGTTVSGQTANIDLDPGETVTCTFTNSKQLPDLTINKQVMCSGPVTPQGIKCTITFTITNNGPGTFNGILVINDTVTPLPSPGISWAGFSTVSSTSGVAANWSCVIGLPTYDIGCSTTGPVTLGPSGNTTFSVNVYIPGGQYQNCVTVRGYAQFPYTPSNLIQEVTFNNNQHCVDFQSGELKKCDLEISKSLAHGIVPPLQPGQQVTFEIIVTNVGTGPCDPPIPVTDTFTGMTYQSGGQIMGPWTCPPGSSATPVTCNYSGTSATPLQPGQSSNFFVNFTVTAKPGEAVENCAEVKHPNDTNPNNNKACIKVPVAEPKEKCDLKITKTVQPNPVPSGQQVTVTLTVQNVGTGPCGPDTVVQDPPTTGLTVPSQQVGVSQSGGTATWGCLILGGGVNCVTASTLPVGYTATFTFTATVTVAPPPGGVANIQNCATVNNPNDPLNPANPGNNQSCVTLQVQGVGNPMDLALVKLLDGQIRVEQEATYVLRVTNVGGRPTTGPIVVSDPLPSGLRFVSASGPGWSCAAQGQNVTCRNAGPIQPGQTSTILLRVRVAAPAGTQITNCATVETAGDANPANNRACHTSTVQR